MSYSCIDNSPRRIVIGIGPWVDLAVECLSEDQDAIFFDPASGRECRVHAHRVRGRIWTWVRARLRDAGIDPPRYDPRIVYGERRLWLIATAARGYIARGCDPETVLAEVQRRNRFCKPKLPEPELQRIVERVAETVQA